MSKLLKSFSKAMPALLEPVDPDKYRALMAERDAANDELTAQLSPEANQLFVRYSDADGELAEMEAYAVIRALWEHIPGAKEWLDRMQPLLGPLLAHVMDEAQPDRPFRCPCFGAQEPE
jgi:hypothetical protein